MFSSSRHTYGLLANLALAVLKRHHFQLPAPCFSPKAGKAEGNPCLRLSCLVRKGGKHERMAAPSLFIKVLTRAYRLCIIKHQSFREFNTVISSVSLKEAKEKQMNFFPKRNYWKLLYQKKNQNASDCLSGQGSTRRALKQIGESTHSKNGKGKTNHTFYQQILKMLYKHRHAPTWMLPAHAHL